MSSCHNVTTGEHVLDDPYPESGLYPSGTLPNMNWCWLQTFTMVAMAPIQSLDGRSGVNQRSTTERGALVRMAIQHLPMTCRVAAPHRSCVVRPVGRPTVQFLSKVCDPSWCRWRRERGHSQMGLAKTHNATNIVYDRYICNDDSDGDDDDVEDGDGCCC